MAPKKLTRKEIVQEDKIHSSLTLVSRWLMAYRVVLLSALGLVIASTIGFYMWKNYQAGQTHELQAQFAEALETFHSQVLEESQAAEGEELQGEAGEAAGMAQENAGLPEPEFQTQRERDEAALEAFQAIADRSPRTRLGQFSFHYVALLQERLGEPNQAKETLEQLLSRSDLPEVRNMARNNLAQMALSAGDHQRAIEMFRGILSESSPVFPKQTVLMRLARSYEEQGDFEEALKAYKQLTSEYPTSDYAREAQTEVDRLEALKESQGA